MAKRNMMAKVHYNSEEDSFELYLKTGKDEEWGFACSSKCRAVEGDTEANFIHFTFLKEVLNCIELGYDVFEA